VKMLIQTEMTFCIVQIYKIIISRVTYKVINLTTKYLIIRTQLIYFKDAK